MYTIAVDAMGGDHAPEVPVKGSLEALRAFDDVCIRLFGRKEAIEPLLAGETYDSARLEVLDAREEISNDEAPMLAVRHKKDASLVRAALGSPERLADLREILTGLVGHDNALIRSAVRIALTELDLADLSDNPGEHLAQVARILDAVLTPDGSGATA